MERRASRLGKGVRKEKGAEGVGISRNRSRKGGEADQ